VTRSGELFTAGARADGQLGVTDSNLDINNYDDAANIPITRIFQFGFDNKAVKVSCGDNYTIVLNEQG
jgi:alpha-tubulin suppressor-like RCC1 family protein